MSSSIARQIRRHSKPEQNAPLNINYGHNGTFLVMQFTRPSDHITLTQQQADDMIAALQQSKAMLAEHQEKLNG